MTLGSPAEGTLLTLSFRLLSPEFRRKRQKVRRAVLASLVKGIKENKRRLRYLRAEGRLDGTGTRERAVRLRQYLTTQQSLGFR